MGSSFVAFTQNILACSQDVAHSVAQCFIQCAGLSESSLLYHNNVLSLPIMASYMLIATNEVQTVQQYPQLGNIWFLVSWESSRWQFRLLKLDQMPYRACLIAMCFLQMFLGISASQAFLLNLCIFRCTTINSPLATTITGILLNALIFILLWLPGPFYQICDGG